MKRKLCLGAMSCALTISIAIAADDDQTPRKISGHTQAVKKTHKNADSKGLSGDDGLSRDTSEALQLAAQELSKFLRDDYKIPFDATKFELDEGTPADQVARQLTSLLEGLPKLVNSVVFAKVTETNAKKEF